jgi:hypothetical protein
VINPVAVSDVSNCVNSIVKYLTLQVATAKILEQREAPAQKAFF